MSSSRSNILAEGHMDHNTHLFSRFTTAIHNVNVEKVATASDIPAEFLLGQEGALSSHYIPFDYVNRQAKVVLVGITPGLTQWKNAVREAQQQLLRGASTEDVRIAAKRTGAFSGAMRPNLVSLLDRIGIHNWLKIGSCDALFGTHAHLVQTTSILRHPVFVSGENYNGSPSMIRTPFLRAQILEHFAKEAAELDNPVYIPLGPKVSEGLEWLAREGVLKRDRILNGLPHPSGANAERIAYFLGRKERTALSAKTNAAQLDKVKDELARLVAQLT